MPQDLTWRGEWAVYIEALDEDHRALVDLLSEICRRYCAGYDRPGGIPAMDPWSVPRGELITSLEELGQQVRAHFRREESFMRSIQYPGLPDHQCEHALLMAEYTAMVRILKGQGAVHLDHAAMEDLHDWLIPEVLGADRAVADFYFQLLDEGRPDGRR
jgi:hemerythrin